MLGSDGLCGNHLKNKLSSTKATTDDSAKSNDDEHNSITEPTTNVTPNSKKKKKLKSTNNHYSSPPDYSGSKSGSSTPSSTPTGIRTLQMSTEHWTPPTSPLLPPGFSTPFFTSRGLLKTLQKSTLSPPAFSSKSPPVLGSQFRCYPTHTPACLQIRWLRACHHLPPSSLD